MLYIYRRIFEFAYFSRIVVKLFLQVHPIIGRYAKSLFQSSGIIIRQRTSAIDNLT